MTFKELGLKSEVLKSLTEMGFEAPTPIQLEAIPNLLASDSDLVGLAQTGTGKTAAFGLPLVNKVDGKSRTPQGLVVCPTRELCLQITKDLENYAKYLDINIVAVYGGADIRRQVTQINKGVSIVVATPGRLVDLIKRKSISLAEVRYVVLDEADEMLNMGFKEDLDLILDSTPKERNVWLFSATMPKEVERISKNYMHNPFEVSIGHKNQSNENIEHIYYSVKERDRYPALKRVIDFNPDIYGLIFCRTRMETASVADKLGKEGYSAEPLHGDLSQVQRDRVMDRFRRKDIQILVATDVAARGLDIDNITHVLNYNLPDDIENYTHRSGRTARAGKKGQSIVLINTRENFKIRTIEKQIRVSFEAGVLPKPEDICAIQLNKLIQGVIQTEVKEKEIEKFMPQIMAEFEELSKEEVVKKFVSAEFNRFIDYYSKAGDLNAASGRDSDKGRDRHERNNWDRDREDDRPRRRDRGANGAESGKTRFFVSVGNRDGLNPGGLLRLICDNTGLQSGSIGRIDIMPAFSFFEADQSETDSILRKVNGAEYEGTVVNIEVTKEKSGAGSSDRRGSSGGFGGRKEGGFGGSARREGSFGNGQPRNGGFGGGQRRGEGPRSRDSHGSSSFGGGRGRDGGNNYSSSRERSSSFGSDRSGNDRNSGSNRGGFGKPFNKGKSSF
jgi:ATP-dependent RNA helicase DeaD